MKKVVAILVTVVACIAVINFTIKYAHQQAVIELINNDKYTQEEYSDFQKLLSEKKLYYYNNLTDVQKDAYITLYYSALNFDDSCILSLSLDDVKDVLYAIIYDNSNIFWLTGSYSYIEEENYIDISLEYIYEKAEADKITKNLQRKVDKIISDIPAGAGEFEKELYLHDYICSNTVYDEETFKNGGDTAFSSLLDGRSICEGYARAMQTLLDNAGIENYLITGDATSDGKTEPHMWNIVNINGCNYHLDVTWDDGIYEDEIGYFYFNVTDEYILRDHSKLEPSENNCSYNYANYFKMKNTFVETFTGFNNLVTPTADILKNGENSVGFLFKNKSDYQLALEQMENNSSFFGYVNNSVRQSGRRLQYDNIEYFISDEFYYLCIIFKER